MIEIALERYEELIQKEEQLNILLRIIRGDAGIAANTILAITNYEDDGK